MGAKKVNNAKTAALLYRISKAMAAVKDGRELLKIIIAETQQVFGFYDIGLSVLDKSGEFYIDWAVLYKEISPSEANFAMTEIDFEKISVDEPLYKYAIARIETEKKPFIIDITAEFIEKFRDFPHLPLELEYGYKQYLVTTLKFGGKTLGVLNFNSQKENHFENCDLELFQAIADLVAVAVANITANEELIESGIEKTKLLSISNEIAKVQTRKQLLNVIFTTIKDIFPYDDAGLFYFCDAGGKPNPNGKYYVHLLDDLISEVNIEIVEQNITGVLNEGVEGVRFHAQNKAFITTLDLLIEDFPGHPFFPIMERDGIRQFITKGIKIGGETIGMISFNSRRENFYSKDDFPLFDNIVNQIAVAMANILAKEEILEREREKSMLLSISQAIATIQNTEQLFKVIFERIQPLFGFYDVGLFVLSNDGKYITDWAGKSPEMSPSFGNQLLNQQELHTLTFANSPLQFVSEELARTGSPLVFRYDEDYLNWMSDTDFRAKLKAIIETGGYREFLAIPLKTGGKLLGLLFFNTKTSGFFDAEKFSLFQTVADQISVAVANIKANEEILERTCEKSVLLSISEDIASARNAVELMQVIREKARQLIPFSDTGILIVEDNGEHHYDLAVNLVGWDNSEGNQKLQTLNLNRIVHPGSYVEFVMQLIGTANSPIIEDYERRFQEFNHPFFKIMKDFGVKEAIVGALKSGGKTFGTLWLNSLEKDHFKPEQFEIFQALADQVAVAVSNILANDEIKKQLTEITDLKKRLEAENKYLTEEVRKNYNFEEIIGTSLRLQEVFEIVETVAPTDATVLIQGETGTGKELIARAIHNRSIRNTRALIKVNCATLPRELVESELFGHERGAFTGATEKRIGKFELANHGTIFLDEIGELPLEMQIKFLRVLQEKEIERLGGKNTINLNLRVVAATNRNLAKEVEAGRFRADLYYRLSTVELFLPPLSERREDIEALTLHFARKYAAKFSRQIESISTKMLNELNAYDFPGNIRELEHIVEHAVIFSKNGKLILPRSLNTEVTGKSGDLETSVNHNESTEINGTRNLQDVERDHIINVLQQTAGRIKGKNGAAEILGLKPATVYFRMNKLGIDKKNL